MPYFKRLRQRSAAVSLVALLLVWVVKGVVDAAPLSDDTAAVELIVNDRHVVTKPTRLEHDRVITAIARGSAIFVPAKALFADLGATVIIAGDSIRVEKGGSVITLTVGKAEIVVNGESRPLDVAPRYEAGVLLVPIRVLSEGLGAYVAWLPQRKTVVIRSVATSPLTVETPLPTSAATAAPASPAPVATPQPKPSPLAKRLYSRYIAVDLALVPRVSNEFAPANTVARVSGQIRGAFEYHFLGNRFIEIESHDWKYQHPASRVGIPNGTACTAATNTLGDPGCVALIGSNPQRAAYVTPALFTERQTALNSGFIGSRHAYLAISNIIRSNSYGYPKLAGSLGAGVELLPDFTRAATISGSVFYYSDVHGKVGTTNNPIELSYKLLTYELHAALTKPGQPLFVEIGIIGDHYIPKANAPSGQTHRAAHLGIGIHI